MTMGSPFQSLTTLLPGGYSLRSIPPSSPQSPAASASSSSASSSIASSFLVFWFLVFGNTNAPAGASPNASASYVSTPTNAAPDALRGALGRTRGSCVSNDDETRDPEESASALAMTPAASSPSASSSTMTSPEPPPDAATTRSVVSPPPPVVVVLSGGRTGTHRTMRHTGDPSTTCGANRSPQRRWSPPGMRAKNASMSATFAKPRISIWMLDSGTPTAPVTRETSAGSRPAATPTVWTHSPSISSALAL
ncbi:predicted protein [Micromonas commoda]|uniref:Uncharacterized protein n=1 Tax=Micromonas commoda (strain RCC299 / NOUM17 / CCMP2709) TaxID=296587 RepID=C1FIQ3_MICCC|nr:predicted protein [Micromonas commoda]ACO70214.1 predicted protein [Micromonas commoda]|eukprot:XP_002508956.1 predicted protein [Micromonas commoda]